ncbi:MAG: hypothetical protein ACJAT2_002108 [Bacteriovoracaceae bacterium]
MCVEQRLVIDKNVGKSPQEEFAELSISQSAVLKGNAEGTEMETKFVGGLEFVETDLLEFVETSQDAESVDKFLIKKEFVEWRQDTAKKEGPIKLLIQEQTPTYALTL